MKAEIILVIKRSKTKRRVKPALEIWWSTDIVDLYERAHRETGIKFWSARPNLVVNFMKINYKTVSFSSVRIRKIRPFKEV